MGKSGEDASGMISATEDNRKLIAQKEVEVQEAKIAVDARWGNVGNLVHDSVPVSNDEVNLNISVFREFI